MRFSITIKSNSPSHTWFALHANGGCSGGLCMRKEEVQPFVRAMTIGCDTIGLEPFTMHDESVDAIPQKKGGETTHED